jgi:regulator of nucleoside diphosphate kinase
MTNILNLQKQKTIYITEYDKERLQKLIREAFEFNLCKKTNLVELDKELSRSEIVKPEDIPADVITMNSRVSLRDIDSGEKVIYSLVFPNDADIKEGKISVLAPIGTAILGYQVGDIIEWAVPDGKVRLKVEEILYQPEAEGNFIL